MKKFSGAFRALWAGEIVSEFGGAAGAIINGLLLYEITGSKEWMGILWLVYYIPSLLLQMVSSPFLNHIEKGKMLKNIQLIRSISYTLPLLGYLAGSNTGTITGLVLLQCILGLVQPIYASLSFSLLPDICKEDELVEANGLLDGTLRLMGFIAPGVTSLLLIVMPMQYIHVISAMMFFISFLSLSHIQVKLKQLVPTWTKKFWWAEMKLGYKTFFQKPKLVRLTFLSSLVQFAVGASMVLSVPFIRGELKGETWVYAIFSGCFSVGYAIGTLLLRKLPRNNQVMYLGLIGGGVSFILLFFVNLTPLAWLCELFGGMLFPLFNAQSAAIFQKEAPRERLSQLSAVRLMFFRITTPLGILFASSHFIHFSSREIYLIVGTLIAGPGLFYLITSFREKNNNLLDAKTQKLS
ncbi:MFS transporter [Peribacillus sp. B-H-3]|uniref:MFS transporter n=1 Tax=Peribacillus sp. B-H-3 TaxID=3400420 RepID=UPI003B0101DD